jgi:hypothetical protein
MRGHTKVVPGTLRKQNENMRGHTKVVPGTLRKQNAKAGNYIQM